MPTKDKQRKGTTQLNPTGIPEKIVIEFNSLRKGIGPNGRDLTVGEMFGKIYEEWTELREMRSTLLSLKNLPSTVRELVIKTGNTVVESVQESSRPGKQQHQGK